MPSTQFKLTKNGHIRRLTLPDQPNWLALATRIESYFDIPADKVAVAYTDDDGDEVTLSSQEELLDFFTNCHKSGESAKFNVIDLSKLRSARGGAATHSAFDDSEKSHISPAGLGSMGPTMIFEVDDHDWQHLPHIYPVGDDDDLLASSDRGGSSLGHAYVETVDSEESKSKKRSDTRSPSLLSKSSKASTNTLKGKEKAGGNVTGTSTGSLLEEEAPFKPTLHVKDFSNAGASPRMTGSDWKSPTSARSKHLEAEGPRFSAFGGVSGTGNVHLSSDERNSPPESQGTKPLPQTPSSRPSSFLNVPPSQAYNSRIIDEEPVQLPGAASQAQSAAGPNPSHSDSTGTPRARNLPDEAHTELPSTELPSAELPSTHQPQRSFINDVANLIDSLTAAFAAHPELSEGLHNIVRAASSGEYWSTERERAANAAENIRRAAEETSYRISQVADEVHHNAEQEAGRRIAQSLAGVFRVIGELSCGIAGLSSEGRHGNSAQDNQQPRPFGQTQPPHPAGWNTVFTPPPPPPFGIPVPPPFGPVPPHVVPPPPILFPTMGHGVPPPHVAFAPGDNQRSLGTDPSSIPPHMRTRPWMTRNTPPRYPPQRSNSWSFGPVADEDTSRLMYHYAAPETQQAEHQPSVHDRKAHLDAAKAYYRAQKESFRKEKEERRRIRRESAEKRAEEGLNTSQEAETIVTRIPLGVNGEIPRSLGTARQRRMPYAEIYGVPSPSKVQPRAGPSNSQGNTAARAGPSQASEKKDRVIAGLMEMGITQSQYPNLNTLLDQHMQAGDTTEAVMTKMVDELRMRRSPSPRR